MPGAGILLVPSRRLAPQVTLTATTLTKYGNFWESLLDPHIVAVEALPVVAFECPDAANFDHGVDRIDELD